MRILALLLVCLAGCSLFRSEKDAAIGKAAADASAMAQGIPLALDAEDEDAVRILAASTAATCAGIQAVTAPDAKPTMDPATYAKAPEAAPAIARARVEEVQQAVANPWWLDLLLKVGGALGLDSGLMNILSGVGLALASGGAGAAILAGVRAATSGGKGGIVESLVRGVQAARAALSPTNQGIVDQQLAAAQDAATKREVQRVKQKLKLPSVKKTTSPPAPQG